MRIPGVNKTSSAGRVRLFQVCLIGCTTLVSAIAARAEVVQFGQFMNDGSSAFEWTNNSPSASANFDTVPGGAPVTFSYTNQAGLPADLRGPQKAHLILSTSTTAQTKLANGQYDQPVNGPLTISVIRDTPAAEGSGARTDLLTATMNSGMSQLVGSGNSAALTATAPPDGVQFSSDFLSFKGTPQSLALALTAIDPALSVNSGNNILNSFHTAMIGNFSSVSPAVPEPASLALIGIGAAAILATRVRRRHSRE